MKQYRLRLGLKRHKCWVDSQTRHGGLQDPSRNLHVDGESCQCEDSGSKYPEGQRVVGRASMVGEGEFEEGSP